MPQAMDRSSNSDSQTVSTEAGDPTDSVAERPGSATGALMSIEMTPETEQTRPNTGDRREPREDRRNHDDRRNNSLRRGRDRQRNAAAKQIAYFGTILCALSVAVGIYAFLKPPISFTPSPTCADGFGGQRVEHRGLSALWAVVMVLAAAGLVIPDRKRRPVLLMILCGVSVGLFAGAYFTVGTKLSGLCFV
jgi:hypothetical protein